jgi:hypothetical protein
MIWNTSYKKHVFIANNCLLSLLIYRGVEIRIAANYTTIKYLKKQPFPCLLSNFARKKLYEIRRP